MVSLFKRPSPHHLPPRRRIYAIGDIHGRLDLLEALTAEIAADDAARQPANTEIILLGDLVDRGPHSSAVVTFAMTAQPAFANLVTIKGNHESVMLAALKGDLNILAKWLNVGGRDTLESYGLACDLLESDDLAAIHAAAREAVPAPHRFWLASLPMSLRIGDYLFVHAGVRPGIPLQEQEESDMLWIRDDFLQSNTDFGVTVVHGHTPAKRAEIRRNRIGIDTGAFFSNKLTAVGIEGNQRWLLST